MAKKFVIRFVVITLSLLLLIAATVFVFDPLYLFHLPWFGLRMPQFSERYQNAGLIRNYDYNAVIMGSSMVESNRASWYDEAFGCRTLKLTFAAGFLPEYDMALSLIYRHKALDYVFFNLDSYALIEGSDYQRAESPVYLYDDNPWNNVNYLWNRDVLLDVLPEFIVKQDDPTPFEDAYGYGDASEFGRENALMKYRLWLEEDGTPQPALPRDAYLDDCAQALARLEKHIAAHPETRFMIFIPPYSILFWDRYIRTGEADAVIRAYDRAAEILLAYDNVRLFCFMGADEIITDLDHYSDEAHFDRSVSEKLVDYMKEGRYELTADNHEAFCRALSDYVWSYDYEALLDGAP